MFEVGKRYRKNYIDYECTAVGRHMTLLEFNGEREYSVSNDSFPTFTEIRPKRRIEAWVNVYKRDERIYFGKEQYPTREDAYGSSGGLCIDTIKIEYEEK